jgi:hypothetical protein
VRERVIVVVGRSVNDGDHDVGGVVASPGDEGMGVGSAAELANNFVAMLECPKVQAGLSIGHTSWRAQSMPRVADTYDAE